MFRLPQKTLTIPVFTIFSVCGFFFIVVQMALSHAPDYFLAAHKRSLVPLSLTNNIFPLIDKIFTPLISFFVAAFGDPSSKAYPTVVHFVWSFGCAIQLPLIEAERSGMEEARRRGSLAVKLISYPMIWGIFYQRLSGGWIIPLWLLAFMQSRVRAEGSGVDRIKAESVLAGWLIGHTLPALVMLVPGQPPLSKAPLWVAFPILMSLVAFVAEHGYSYIRSRFHGTSSLGAHSGYSVIQVLYLVGFIPAFYAHISLVLIPGLSSAPFSAPTHEVFLNKLIGLMRYLYTFFIPATGLHIPSPAQTTAESGVVHFVQFDVLIVFGAMWTALVWDLAIRRSTTHTTKVETFRWVALVASMLFIGGLVVSPGGATSLLLMYREYKLNSSRRSVMRRTARRMTGSISINSSAENPKRSFTYCTSHSFSLSVSEQSCLLMIII